MEHPKEPPKEPRQNPELVDQGLAERALLESAQSGRLAHAWLLAGPQGVGKATLAYRFARFLLAGESEEAGGLFETPPQGARSAGLAIDPGHPVFRRVASGGHADLKVLARAVNPKTGKLRSEIVVDEVREAIAFLRLTPSEGGWRVVVVDGAEDMNRNSQNALLKVLEEPPPRAVLLLVCHAPGRLLPTIRSRCRRLDLRPLPAATIARLIAARVPDLPEADRALAAGLAEGSIGRALAILEAGGVELYRDLATLLLALPRLDAGALHRQAERLARSGGEESYRLAAELLLGWLNRTIKLAAAGEGAGPEFVKGERAAMERLGRSTQVARWIELAEEMRREFTLVEAVNLDRRQVWISSLLGIQRLAAA
jgi:DNA polymerase III subunit delta'